ncbi:MAG: V-type ATP synthase subunit I [Gammaproteobacteria bacterium]
MAVLPLRRISVLGPLADKREALEQLQVLGCVHLIASIPAKDDEAPTSDEGRDARDALRFLEDCQTRRHQVPPETHFDMSRVVARALDIKQNLRERVDRREFLLQRTGLLGKWGDFRLPPGGDIAGYRLWFYVVPFFQMDKVHASGLIWQEVRRGHRHAYVVVVSKTEPEVMAMPVPRTHTGSVPLSRLREELEQLELQIEDLSAERASLTRWVDRLRDNLYAAEDRATLARAVDETWSEKHVFAIQGWAPEAAIERIRGFTDSAGLALLERKPASREAPPTLLDNTEQLGGGQEIVSFWQLPGYHDLDPSSVVAISFATFFAMIMSDAGYALVLAAILALFWRRMLAWPSGPQLRNLGLLIVGMSVIYGVLVGSYFGVNPDTGTLAASFQVLDVQDYQAMMRLVIMIGAAHLALGNVMAGWSSLGRHVAWGRFGWAGAIVGGLLLWLGWQRDPDGIVARSGMLLMAAGLVAILLFSGEQHVWRPKDMAKRLLQGGLALTSVTRAFGDVLSYLRLFALGLASASLAMTFNDLAGQVQENAGRAGTLLAATLLLLGHTLNFVLIMMSAVVHGLRLNLIEFFNWSVTEEGYPFRAFHRRGGR